MKNLLFTLLFLLFLVGCSNSSNNHSSQFILTTKTPQVTVAGSPAGGTIASGVPLNSAIQIKFWSNISTLSENLARITLYHYETNSSVPLFYETSQTSNVVLLSTQMHGLSANSNYSIVIDSTFTFEDNTTLGQTFFFDFNTSTISDFTSAVITLENNASVPQHLQGSLKFRSNEPLNIHHASTQTYYFVKDNNTSVQIPANVIAGSYMSMFTPAWALEPNTTYTLTLPILYDLANNPTYNLSTSITTESKFTTQATFNEGVDFGMRVDQSTSTSIAFFDGNRMLHLYRPDPMFADLNYTEQNSSYFYENNRTIYNLDANQENIFVFSKESNDSNGTIRWFQASNLVNTMNVFVSDSFEQNATYTMIDVNSSGMGYGCIVKNDLNTSNVHLYDYMSNALNLREALSITTPLSCHINADTGALYIIAADNRMYIYNVLTTYTRTTMNYSYIPANFMETNIGRYWTNGSNALYFRTDIDAKIKLYTLSQTTIEYVTMYGSLAFVGNSTSPQVYVIDFSDTPQLIATLSSSAPVTSLAVATHDYNTGNANIRAKALLVGHADTIEQISLAGFSTYPPKILVPLSYKPTGIAYDIEQFNYFIWHENMIEEFDNNNTLVATHAFTQTIHQLIPLTSPYFIVTHTTGLSIINVDTNSTVDERNVSNINTIAWDSALPNKIYVGTNDGGLFSYNIEFNNTLTDNTNTYLSNPITSIFYFNDATYPSLLVGTQDKNITIFHSDSNGTLLNINQILTAQDVPLDIKAIGTTTAGYAIAVAEGFSGVQIFHPDNSWATVEANHTVTALGYANSIDFSYVTYPQNDYILNISDTTGLTTVMRSVLDTYDETSHYSLGGIKLRGLLFESMYGQLTHMLTEEGLIVFDTSYQGIQIVQ